MEAHTYLTSHCEAGWMGISWAFFVFIIIFFHNKKIIVRRKPTLFCGAVVHTDLQLITRTFCPFLFLPLGAKGIGETLV
jgi:hypothetical protein